jgi:hypothetical protein
MTPELRGVLETSLYVSDLERSRAFCTRLFSFPVLLQDDRFCALSVCGRQVLLLFRKDASVNPVTTPGGTIPPHGGEGWDTCWNWPRPGSGRSTKSRESG